MSPNELNQAIAQAMKDKNKNKTAALRQIKQLVVNYEKNTGKIADDTIVANSAKNALKATIEEAEIREKKLGTNDERAQMLYEQAAYIEEIAPKEMSETELEPYVKQAIETCGATSMRDMRNIMAEVSKIAPAAFDNKMLSTIVKRILMGN